jgi:Fic family protein
MVQLTETQGSIMDKMVTVKTFKSGHVVLSSQYQASKLTESLTEAKILHMTVRDLPIVPHLAAPIEEELIRRSIFGTAAIEGNPLSEEKVGEIVAAQPLDASKQLEQFEQEIKNLKEAYSEFVVRCVQTDSPIKLQEEQIRKVHAVITNQLVYDNNVPGNYRNERVKVGDKDHGGIYTPPKILADIETLMKAFIDWINSDEVLSLEPIIRASLAHYYIGLIHPFRDGNGRTARIIEAYLLTCSGYKYVPIMLSNFYYRNIDQYFLAFSLTERDKHNDMTHFLEFTLRGFVESLRDIKDRIIFLIRKLALRDYYLFLRNESEISQRQYDLLILMLNQSTLLSFRQIIDDPPFSLLYRNVVERTAKRDLSKLCDSGYLKCEQDKYFTNLKLLDSFGSVFTTKAK